VCGAIGGVVAAWLLARQRTRAGSGSGSGQAGGKEPDPLSRVLAH
jgi:hypothetical protein